jgi:hypothetical protein
MVQERTLQLCKSIRHLLIFFIVSLILSGITAFPLETELKWVCSWWPEKQSAFYLWLNTCMQAISDTNAKYPYLAYGYDWLAFAHLVIAVVFIGPLRDPVKNIWVIEFGIIACAMIIPLALFAGHIRQIPFFWRLIDCSFGLVGWIPLYYCHKKIRQLERLQSALSLEKNTGITVAA